MKNFKYIRVLIVCFCFTQTFAQDLKKDLERINAVYSNAKKYSLNYEYLYFDNQTSKAPYQTLKSGVTKVNDNYYYQQGDVETIMCNTYSLRVDKEDKSITLLPRQVNSTKPNPTGINLDSLSDFCKKTEFKKVTNDIYSYTFTMIEGWDYNKLELRFNKDNFQIARVIYYFKGVDISDDDKENITDPKIEIVYSKFNTAITMQEKDISYEKFLTKKGNKYELKPEFIKYKLYAY